MLGDIETAHSDRQYAFAEGRLHQEVAPELTALRQEPSWRASDLQVSSMQSVAVQHVSGPSWCAKFTLERGDAAASGLLLRSWLHQGPEEGQQPCAAALLVNWDKSLLEVGGTGSTDSSVGNCLGQGLLLQPWPASPEEMHALVLLED